MAEGGAEAAGASSASSGAAAAEAAPAPAAAEQRVQAPGAAPASRGVDVLTGPSGEVMGFSVSPVMQVYSMLDKIIAMQRVFALPVAERFALAGKVAAVPDEHARIAERLASAVGTSVGASGALNALYVLEACQELVPGFKEHITQERLAKAAELSPHDSVKGAVLRGEKPPQWEKAAAASPSAVVLLQQPDDDEDEGLLTGAGRAVGDATRFVGGAAFGGVGMVTDKLGLTSNAEDALAETAEDAVDIVGDGVNAVIGTVDDGLDGTAQDLHEKGVVGAVGDGVADAVDMVSDFVGDAVGGIADGVHGILSWATGETPTGPQGGYATHKLAIVVAELFGEERSLGLLLEERIVKKFTKPEAEKLGFRLGDCIVGVGAGLVRSQEDMLAAIGAAKDALKSGGTPIRFLVERLGAPPAAAQ